MQYSDTLRLELAPFEYVSSFSLCSEKKHANSLPSSVNVTTVVTGIVKTNIWTKDPDLSTTSRYYPINDQYVATRQNSAAAKGATEPDVYARWLVGQTAGKKAPGWLYKGVFGTRAWLMSWAVPRGVVLGALSSMYGVDKLGPRLKAQGTKKTA